MNETMVTVVGNLVADPERRSTKTGVPFAAFRVASTVRRLNPQSREYEDGGTSYYNVTAFRAIGANAFRSLKRGEPVLVYGRQRVNQFVRSDNSLGTTVEIDAYHVGHDLGRGVTAFTKVAQAQFDNDDRLADPEVQAAFGEQGLPDPQTVPYEVPDDGIGEDATDDGASGTSVASRASVGPRASRHPRKAEVPSESADRLTDGGGRPAQPALARA